MKIGFNALSEIPSVHDCLRVSGSISPKAALEMLSLLEQIISGHDTCTNAALYGDLPNEVRRAIAMARNNQKITKGSPCQSA